MRATSRQSRVNLRSSRSTARQLPAWTLLIALMVGVAAAFGLSKAWGAESDVVARVNGEAVTRVEVQRLVANPTHRRQVQEELGVEEPGTKDLQRLALRNLIYRRLLLQEAARRSITATEQEVSRNVNAIQRRFKKPRKYAAWLKASGLDEKSLREYARANLLIARVQMALVEGLQVEEQQVQEYYDRHKDKMEMPAARSDVERQLLAAKRKEAIAAWLKEEETKSKIEILAAAVGDEGSAINGARRENTDS
jgi:hypothetical protein